MVDKTFGLEPNEALKQKKEANHEASNIVDLKKNKNKISPHHHLELINTCSHLKLHLWHEAWLIFLTLLHQTFDPAALC